MPAPIRSDIDYAIEFGRHLATVAELFMAEQNRAAKAGVIPVAEFWTALQSAIYEFRKRADKAEVTTRLVRRLAVSQHNRELRNAKRSA